MDRELHEQTTSHERRYELREGEQTVALLVLTREGAQLDDGSVAPAYILNVWVAPEMRGQGLASRLLAHARAQLPEGVEHSADLTDAGMRWALTDPAFEPKGYGRTYGSNGYDWALDNSTWWERAQTQDPQLDALIQAFGRSTFEDHGADEALESGQPLRRPIFELVDLDVAAGRCMDVSESFAEAARAHGMDAQMLDTDQDPQVEALYGEYDSSASIPFHMVVQVATSSGQYLVDWTSSQFDGLDGQDFPLVHRRESGTWQRIRPRPDLSHDPAPPDWQADGPALHGPQL
jgi:GNAT superfamily N-acetyltransferase